MRISIVDVKVGLPHFSRRYTLYTNTCVYIHRSQHTYSRAHARALTHMCVSASHKSTRIKLACIRAHAHVPKHGRAHDFSIESGLPSKAHQRQYAKRRHKKTESVAIETAPTTAVDSWGVIRVAGRRTEISAAASQNGPRRK